MKTSYILLVLLILVGCSKNEIKSVNEESEWLVDEGKVTGIFSLFPLAINTEFNSVLDTDLPDSELVGVMNFGSEIRVYPYVYTFESEVVNDSYTSQKYVFSYCPITKSAIAFTRDQVFRASGYLYNDNLTPWDEKTETIWSQMLIRGIKGEKKNQRLNTIPVVETVWKTIKDYFPNAKVIKNLAASSRSVGRPPDGDGDDDNNQNAPDQGQYVYGIIDDFNNINIFKYNDFLDKNRIDVTIQSQNYIVYGSASKRIINAFKVGRFEDYQVVENEFPIVLKSQNGVRYNILGIGNNGIVLEKPKYAYVAIWKAWDDFYDNFHFVE